MKLFQFELKKIFFNKRFLYLMIFIILFISALFFRNYIFQATISQEREAYILSSIQEGQRSINHLQQEIINNPDDEKAHEKLIQMDEIINTLYELRTAFNENDWRKELEIENIYLKQVQAYKTGGGDFSLLNEQINRTLALNAEHLAKNIQPQHQDYSKAQPNFIKQTVDILVNFGVIALILIMVGDTLTGEFEQRSIHLLFSQPLKKSTIIHSKFWSAFIVYVFVIICSLIVAWCIPLFLGEQGTFSYPVLIEQNGDFSFMTIKEYLIYSLISGTVIIVLALTLCLFVSLLFKHTIITLLAMVVILLGGYTLFNQLSISNIAFFNPFQYVLTKETISEIGYNWDKGIGITLALAILFYLLSLWRIHFVRV